MFCSSFAIKQWCCCVCSGEDNHTRFSQPNVLGKWSFNTAGSQMHFIMSYAVLMTQSRVRGTVSSLRSPLVGKERTRLIFPSKYFQFLSMLRHCSLSNRKGIWLSTTFSYTQTFSVGVPDPMWNKSFPKSFGKNHVATPHGKKMDSPTVRASCALPTADESNHLVAGMLHPHHRDGQRRLHVPC